jgi:hypothetical protein
MGLHGTSTVKAGARSTDTDNTSKAHIVVTVSASGCVFTYALNVANASWNSAAADLKSRVNIANAP